MTKKYPKPSKCDLGFVLHLMKQDENAKYLHEFRKLVKVEELAYFNFNLVLQKVGIVKESVVIKRK